MGVSMSWKPTDPNRGTFFAGGSTLHRILETTFRTFPTTFTEKDVGKLEGVAACGYDDLYKLITAIHEHGSVDVEAHW